MDRRVVIEKTKEYVSGKWFNIVLILFLIQLFNNFVSAIFGVGSVFSIFKVFTLLGTGDFFKIGSSLFVSRAAVGNLISSFIASILSGAFTIALFKAVVKNSEIQVSDIIDNAMEFMMPLIVSSIISSVILTLVGIIPVIGFIASIIIGYALGFRIFLLADMTTDDGVDAIRQSFVATNGYKMDMFMIQLHYYLIPIIVLLVSWILGTILFKMPFLSVTVFMLGTFVAGIAFLYYGPFLAVANIILYLERKNT